MMNDIYKESEQYLQVITDVMVGIRQQQPIIDELAKRIVQAYCDNKLFHVFGTAILTCLLKSCFIGQVGWQ